MNSNENKDEDQIPSNEFEISKEKNNPQNNQQINNEVPEINNNLEIKENIQPENNKDNNDKNNNNKNDNINNNNENNNNKPNAPKHGKCVPLAIYQKVFDDKQKLISQLDIINNQLKTSLNNDKISLISSLQNELKNVKREKQFLENIVLKQEKTINNLQNKILKYDKQLNKKNEELLIKEDAINELKEKIEELIANNKNIKNNFKINEKNEIIKMNDIINNLKNELEIKDKKMELNDVKYNNLQIKYLKLFQQKRKIENESLLKMSKEQLTKVRNTNNYSTPKKFFQNNNNTINLNKIKNNEIAKNLPLINDVNSSINITKNNNNRYIKKKQDIDIKESYSMTNND